MKTVRQLPIIVLVTTTIEVFVMKKHILIAWLAFGAGVLVACGAQVGADRATATTASADVALKTSGPVVATDRGPVRGLSADGLDKFLGVPYAAPPIGSLRWRPPQPAQRWTGLREASQFGSACPQVPNPFGTASTNEDCLYLNVFTPTDAHGDHGNEVSHKLPVMVWLHTGALIVGSGDVFDPTPLVAQGVVVVTFNYRVGFLGTLAHPALSNESPDHTSGNYGIQDQQAALRWVQRNIGAFGGDPARVTIFGESAGALSAHAHLASPLSADLFRAAIAESPPNSLAKKTLETAEAEGAAYAQVFGCSGRTAETLACLRAVSVDALLEVAPPQGYLIVDGHVVTQQIGATLESGEFNEVPVLQGTNHDEWTLQVGLLRLQGLGPITADQYPAFLGQVFGFPPNVAAFVMTLYPLAAYPTPSNAVGAIGTDMLFACPSRQEIRLLANHVKVFAYEFNDANAPQRYLPPFGFPYGAYHAAEIQYLSAMPPPLLNEAQVQLSEVMIRYWTNFAKALDPNGDGLPAWPQYALETDVFQSLVPPVPAPETGFASDHKCWLWSTQPQ